MQLATGDSLQERTRPVVFQATACVGQHQGNALSKLIGQCV